MNMDIVNPIPPMHATAANIFHEAPAGITARPVLTNSRLRRVIPSGFPIHKPNRMPIPCVVPNRFRSAAEVICTPH